MPSDEELMKRVANGHVAAFDELVCRHQHSVWSTACRFTADPVEAEDLAQETFLRVLRAASRYRPTGDFRSYLLRILGRLCLDRSRKKGPVYGHEVPDCGDPSPSPAEQLEAARRGDQVRGALASLPGNQRMAIILKYYEDMNYAQIAGIMGVSEKAIERLLDRGREGLRRRLGAS